MPGDVDVGGVNVGAVDMGDVDVGGVNVGAVDARCCRCGWFKCG